VLAAAALASTASAAATTDRRGVARVERARAVRARVRQVGTRAEVRVRLNATARLLVGLLGQLEHLAKLHALVGLHRLLHVREPRITLSTLRHLLHLQQNLL